MKLYIIRNKETKVMYPMGGGYYKNPTFYPTERGAKGHLTYSKNIGLNNKMTDEYYDFWNNAEVVECELVIPE